MKRLGSAGTFSRPKASSTTSGHPKGRSGRLIRDQTAARVTVRPTQAAKISRAAAALVAGTGRLRDSAVAPGVSMAGPWGWGRDSIDRPVQM